MSFPQLPEMGARMLSAQLVLLPLLYQQSIFSSGQCWQLPSRKKAGFLWTAYEFSYLEVKSFKFGKKQADFSEESLNK